MAQNTKTYLVRLQSRLIKLLLDLTISKTPAAGIGAGPGRRQCERSSDAYRYGEMV